MIIVANGQMSKTSQWTQIDQPLSQRTPPQYLQLLSTAKSSLLQAANAMKQNTNTANAAQQLMQIQTQLQQIEDSINMPQQPQPQQYNQPTATNPGSISGA